jgi:cytosine/adenosine deaminase-related metal-dependent hydrolase
MYAGNYVGGLDVLSSGTTTLVDYCHNIVTPDHAYAALQGLRDAGVRALFGFGYTPVTHAGFAELPPEEKPGFADHAARVAFVHRLATEEFSSADQLVTLAVVPQEIEIADWDEVTAEIRSARELGARMSLHANQVLSEQRWHDVDRLDRAGLLGDDILFVHCTFSSDDEFRLIAEHGAHVCVAVETELQMGMGVPATNKLLAAGVGPSLGVDITSNSSGDMFAQMRLALQVGRMVGDLECYAETRMPDKVRLTTRDALEWATINGARGAGVDHLIGTLTPGKQADLISIRATDLNLAGWNRRDPVGALVLHAHPGNVETVIVAGRVVKRRGVLVHVDAHAALEVLQSSHDRVNDWAEAHGGLIPQPEIALSF